MAEPEKGRPKYERRWQGRPNVERTKPEIRKEQRQPPITQRNDEKFQQRESYPLEVQKSSDKQESLPDVIVAGQYRLLGLLGKGSFGELFQAECLIDGEMVAVKVEKAKGKHQQLPREAKIYEILRGGVGIPDVRQFATEGGYNLMVMDLLGPTLEDLLHTCGHSFSLKTTLMLADQILTRVEFIHRKCFIHRDIKPDNFLMGRGPHICQVFMIDFGLAKKFYSMRSETHIGYNEDRSLVGTARYASIRAHYAEQSRRDDLEAVGYLLLYFQRGRLPWQGIRAQSMKQKYEKIAEYKAKLSVEALCSEVPVQFYLYVKYCRKLHFAEKPDYIYLRTLFKVLFRNKLMSLDNMYDWVLIHKRNLKEKRARQKIKERLSDGDKDRKKDKPVERERNPEKSCTQEAATQKEINKECYFIHYLPDGGDHDRNQSKELQTAQINVGDPKDSHHMPRRI
ncbi:casein kinase I [Drosophila eugracilis]|uniref:casein kinase I n=1 Tax=Drosophila eugracilis TaxID=29029 RepID=UPI001BD9D9ED|nr:casein kinase I [Drosophila eugracilis]